RLRLGEGVAYSTMSDRHLLNVPAGGMSAFTDDAQHFARWSSVNVDSFVPRHTYARYLRETLESQTKANPNVSLRHVQQPARRITTSPLGVTAGEEDVQGDAVVIALGNSAPTCPDWAHALDASRVVRDPWETGALERLPSGARVLCVGTGLTFVDVAITLAARSCRVTAISRHGLLPTVHAPVDTVPTVPASFSKPGDVTRWLRLQPDWRAAFAAIRPETQQLWRSLSRTASCVLRRSLMRATAGCCTLRTRAAG
ncbi:MAG: pyridine nucleotide-disulfide oxidoreductase, partial [Actinobacteria bacterium]|nr:pyridine nucleotide-disulfide oxidoreductase [Actinomycetota bacterium]